MTLQDYLAEHHLTQVRFAARVGVTQAAISRWVTGSKLPTWPQLIRIKHTTDGAVTPNDFLGIAERRFCVPP